MNDFGTPPANDDKFFGREYLHNSQTGAVVRIMKRILGIGFGVVGALALSLAAVHAQQAAPAKAPAAKAPAAAAPATPKDSNIGADTPPMVPPAGPGVFTVKKLGAGKFHLVVAGHMFTNRSDIEKYLAWRAAQLTISEKGDWFSFVELRGKGETADPVPKPDPGAPRFSFRMKYFRPVWTFKAGKTAPATKWSPFTGAAFPTTDPKTITDFTVSADIVVHKGTMDSANPLAYEPRALSDLLINQVSPPT